MEVIIDGVKYLPVNVVQPTLCELQKYLYKLKATSHIIASEKVPAEFVKDDDRGRPFDTAYNKRLCYERGFDNAISEIEYWIKSKQ